MKDGSFYEGAFLDGFIHGEGVIPIQMAILTMEVLNMV